MEININNKLDGSGVTILMIASDRGQLDVMKYLINQDADVNAISRYGNTVLSYAIESMSVIYSRLDVVQLLIDSNAKVTISDLEIAQKQNDKELIKYLKTSYKK